MHLGQVWSTSLACRSAAFGLACSGATLTALRVVVVPAQPFDLLDGAVHAVGKIAAVLQIGARVSERLDEAGGVAVGLVRERERW